MKGGVKTTGLRLGGSRFSVLSLEVCRKKQFERLQDETAMP